eukprot:scaffold6585_cov17-Tisochrysis_lutea.AAC.2
MAFLTHHVVTLRPVVAYIVQSLSAFGGTQGGWEVNALANFSTSAEEALLEYTSREGVPPKEKCYWSALGVKGKECLNRKRVIGMHKGSMAGSACEGKALLEYNRDQKQRRVPRT